MHTAVCLKYELSSLCYAVVHLACYNTSNLYRSICLCLVCCLTAQGRAVAAVTAVTSSRALPPRSSHNNNSSSNISSSYNTTSAMANVYGSSMTNLQYSGGFERSDAASLDLADAWRRYITGVRVCLLFMYRHR